MKEKYAKLKDLFQQVYDTRLDAEKHEHILFMHEGLSIIYYPNAVDIIIGKRVYQVKWELIEGKVSNIYLDNSIDEQWLINVTAVFLNMGVSP